ncbi:MAG: FAD-dependent monooxygenase, partial [Actinomycetes bacterium]
PSAFVARQHLAERAAVGRAALVGDAAHEVSPIGGQGMSLGWLDALALDAALARALAPGPDLLLLDEPFSNLDASLRERLRSEVRSILTEAGVTTLFVTHDQEEALSLADQVAV